MVKPKQKWKESETENIKDVKEEMEKIRFKIIGKMNCKKRRNKGERQCTGTKRRKIKNGHLLKEINK